MKSKLLVMTVLVSAMLAAMCSCSGDGNDDYSSSSQAVVTTAQNTTENVKESEDADSEAKSYSSDSKSDSYSSDTSKEEYYCMGKHDTCNNKTSSPYDYYCHSCDPDDNNVEGDQSSNSYGDGGAIIDNDYDNDIDEEDWENAWDDYVNDKMDDYDSYGY